MTRRALTVAVLAIALFAAVVIQLTVVNRLPFPGAAGSGSTGPDLVLLLVTAIAAATSPLTGAVTGFAGGLALDIAPPAAHYAGEYALVFCLAGYAAARVHHAIATMNGGERDLVTAFTVMVAATAAGEAGKAVLGMLLSDPDVTGAVVRSVLPGALLYDLLLAPLAFWFVAWVTRATHSWGTAPERAPGPDFSHEQRLASVFRQASAGAVPNLRLAGTGEDHRSPAAPRPEAAAAARKLWIQPPNDRRYFRWLRVPAGGRPDRQAELRRELVGAHRKAHTAGSRQELAARRGGSVGRGVVGQATAGRRRIPARSRVHRVIALARTVGHAGRQAGSAFPGPGLAPVSRHRPPRGRPCRCPHWCQHGRTTARFHGRRALRGPGGRALPPVPGRCSRRSLGAVRPVGAVRCANAPGRPRTAGRLAPYLPLGRAGVFRAQAVPAQRLARLRPPPAHRHRPGNQRHRRRQLARRVPVGSMAAAQPSPVAQAQPAAAADGWSG